MLFLYIIFPLFCVEEMPVTVTAYCLPGKTASGTKVREGVVAVDKHIIPLGSQVYIPGRGWHRAEDTGGKIKGRRLDLWNSSRGWCQRWGRKKMKVWVLRSRK